MDVLKEIYTKARCFPQKVAFPEAENAKIMQAAYETGAEGYIRPVLVSVMILCLCYLGLMPPPQKGWRRPRTI